MSAKLMHLMGCKSSRLLILAVLSGLLLALAFGSLVLPARSQGDKPAPQKTDTRLDAVRHGKWPAQLAAHSSTIQPDRHGPQRNDPAEGIPKHAYSPFDERRNRDYPCPPGGCEFVKEWVLVKLAPRVKIQRLDQKGAWTADAALNQALAAQGIARLEPVFPTLTPSPLSPFPSPNFGRGEGGLGGRGEGLPKPDLTRWYRAYLNPTQAPAITGQGEKAPDIYAIVEALRKAPGIAWAEPDYLRRLAEERGSRGTRGRGDKETISPSPCLPLSLSPPHPRMLRPRLT